MEPSGASPPQTTIWRQLQARAKPLLSPKLGSRDAEDKKDRGAGIFKKMKRTELAVLDRVISSSQPDLLLSGGSGPRREKPQKPPVAPLAQTHHKSSSLGSASLEKLAEPPRIAPTASGMYKLEVELKRGRDLAVRDRGGSSDPYVKFKLAGKEVFRSKTIHKNLNPVWEERCTLVIDCLSDPVYVKVFDYDFGLQDDFMGSAYLHLESLEQQRTIPVTLELKDPQHPDQDLGSLDLSVTLTPKDSPVEERRDSATMLLRKSWKRSTKQQSLRLSDLHRKSQLWRGIVSIALIEGRNLIPMDPNGLSDPYVKFRLGPQKYRSKTVPKTLSPQWREQFDLHMYEETGGVLEITVWDKDTGRRDDFLGRCQLDLSPLPKERTHRLDLPLEESRGLLVLLVTLTASSHVSIADLSLTPLDDPLERREVLARYGALRSFSNIKDVGLVQVKVMRAEGLMVADVIGKSDPFCVLELNNDRLQTHTVYKNLNPEWNKVFTFNVKDIHAVLEVTVFDEDRDRSADFLGKVAIPLLRVRNGESKSYELKNKELTGRTKGTIYLEIDVVYNTVKAALRSVVPAEQKYIEDEPKVSKQLLQQNFNRVKRCIMVLISYGTFINSCFEWESAQRSIISFVLFVVVVWNFEVYMLPMALLLLLVWNYVSLSIRGTTDTSLDTMFEWEDEEEDREDKEAEPKGFLDKLYAIQDVFISVQSALDGAASYGERVKKWVSRPGGRGQSSKRGGALCTGITVTWTVPFLSWLAIAALSSATVLLYLVPLRYLLLAWGVNKFTKKLRDPYLIDNNELLDFLSRVPSDVQVMQYRELKADSGQSPSKRRRTVPS
ncbi:multiple C2 and transmembrane domain-containing protein 1 isoform 2-T2 [Spinachia spinachia]